MKKISKIILSLLIASAPISVAFADEESITLNGTAAATVIDVSINTAGTVEWDPNAKTVTAPSISVVNNTIAPIYVNLKNVDIAADSPWKPLLVGHAKRDELQWSRLTSSETNAEIAFGLKWGGEVGHGWGEAIGQHPGSTLPAGEELYPVTVDRYATVWSDKENTKWTQYMDDTADDGNDIGLKTNSQLSPYRLGIIQGTETGKLHPVMMAGSSIGAQKTFKVDMVFEVGLS